MHPVYGFTPPTFVRQGEYSRNNPDMPPVVMGLVAVGIGLASAVVADRFVEPMAENVGVVADKELMGVSGPALAAGTAIYLFGVFMGSTFGGKSDQG
jgi:hypothetical protein